MYDEEDFLLLSGIQHFLFCRRQWALIHIEQSWKENVLTAEGHISHERVHNYKNSGIHNGILTIREMQIKSKALGLSGKCDAVEFLPSNDGVVLAGRAGKWTICPVEYKHGKSKQNDCDRFQVVAQAICLEEMFCCSISEAALFYQETKKREKIIITDEMRESVKNTANEMHMLYKRCYTPHVKVSKKCANCSLNDNCLPELFKQNKTMSAEQFVENQLEDEVL